MTDTHTLIAHESTDEFGNETIEVDGRTFWLGDTYTYQRYDGRYEDVTALSLSSAYSKQISVRVNRTGELLAIAASKLVG